MQVWCACADTWSCGSHAHAVRPGSLTRMLNPGSVGAPGPSGSARPGLCWRGFPMSKQPRNLNAVSGRLQRRMLVAQLSTGTVGNASEPARRTVPGHASRAAVTPASPGAWRVRPRRALGRDAPSHPRPLNAHTRPKVDGRAVIGTQRPSEPARSCSSEGCSVPERTRSASFATRSPTQKGRLTRTVSRRAGSTRAQRSSRARRWFSAPFTAHCHRLLTNEGVIRCRYHPWPVRERGIDREDLGGRNSSVCHDC